MTSLLIALAVGCALAALAAAIADLEVADRPGRCSTCGSPETDDTDLCASCFATAWGVAR